MNIPHCSFCHSDQIPFEKNTLTTLIIIIAGNTLLPIPSNSVSPNPNFALQFLLLLLHHRLFFLPIEFCYRKSTQSFKFGTQRAMLQGRLSFFGGGDSRLVDNNSSKGEPLVPTLKLETDKQVYRPGDPVVVTIQISNPSNGYSFLMERLSFEIKGIEKLDTQWFATQKPLPGSKQRRGWLVQREFQLLFCFNL